MRKLDKRESIIVGIMAIALLYGGGTLLFTKPQNKTASQSVAESAELQALTVAVAATVGNDNQSSRDAYIIARAELDWQHDPFVTSKVYREMLQQAGAPKGGAALLKAVFRYTGYMEFGGKQIAIINGVEHVPGELLEKPGYVLRSITPTKVVIEDVAGRSTIKIPIEE